MDTSVIKKVKFTNLVNIISVITSLLYVLLSIAYFVAMGNTLINGNEYEMLGFIFGLIGLPVVLVFMIIPIFRVIILILTINVNKKIKTGGKTTGLRISAGIMQIIDAVVSFIVFSFTSSFGLLLLTDPLHSAFGDGRLFSTIYLFLGLGLIIPVLAKGIVQIISAVMLFSVK